MVEPKTDYVAIFCKRSGYTASDVLSVNPKTKVVVTSNGGKYQLTARGVRTVQGPPCPKEAEEES